jgi:hypothetical protein
VPQRRRCGRARAGPRGVSLFAGAGAAGRSLATRQRAPAVVQSSTWSKRYSRVVLLAGGAVDRRARVAGASLSCAGPDAFTAANRRWRPSDEKAELMVARTILSPLAHTVGVNGAEHWPAARIEHGHHDLRSARHVEHDPVAHDPAVVDAYAITGMHHGHRRSVLLRRRISCKAANERPARRTAVSPGPHWRDATSNAAGRVMPRC